MVLERLADDGVKPRYREVLQAEVNGFSESTQSEVDRGMSGNTLVSELLADWEGNVNKVTMAVVGEK